MEEKQPTICVGINYANVIIDEMIIEKLCQDSSFIEDRYKGRRRGQRKAHGFNWED